MSTIYVASGIKNYQRVIAIQDVLAKWGITPLFDWATSYKNGEPEDRKWLAWKEIDAVQNANLFLLVLPSGRGAHVELGAAIASGKRCFILCEDDSLDIMFYMHPRVEVHRECDKVLEAVIEYATDLVGVRVGK